MSTNQFGRLLAYRYALAVAREIRQRPGVAEALRRGVTPLDKQLARLEPNKMSVAEGCRLYFAFIRKAERIRRSLLADHSYPYTYGWTRVGYTSGPDLPGQIFPGHVYAAPVGEPAPWEK